MLTITVSGHHASSVGNAFYSNYLQNNNALNKSKCENRLITRVHLFSAPHSDEVSIAERPRAQQRVRSHH